MAFKPPVTPPYATRVPGRSAGEFKTHRTLGQAKQAIANYPNWGQGAALHDMEVLRLDTHQDEYVTWIKIDKGDRYVDHPQILPGAVDPDDPYLALRAASKLVGIPEGTLKQYVEAGTLRSYGVRSLVRLKKADLLALKAANEHTALTQELEEGSVADNIAGFYGGQPAPLPDGVVSLSPEELEEADRYGEAVSAPLDQATIDALNERIAAGDLPVRKVWPVKIEALPVSPGVAAVVHAAAGLPVSLPEAEEDEDPADIARRFAESTRGGVTAPPVTYVIAYNRREFLQWCAKEGHDEKRPDWVYVPGPHWLRKRTLNHEAGYRYLLTPRAQERRDWIDFQQFLAAEKAVRVYPDCVDDYVPNERTQDAARRLHEVVQVAPAPQQLGQDAGSLREARGRVEVSRSWDPRVVDGLCRLLSDAYAMTSGLKMIMQPDPGPQGPLPDMYPLTVLRSRYSGTYEGGKWVAFKDRPDNVEDALGDDITCSSFFRTYGKLRPIGRGDSPEAAIRDLDRQISG